MSGWLISIAGCSVIVRWSHRQPTDHILLPLMRIWSIFVFNQIDNKMTLSINCNIMFVFQLAQYWWWSPDPSQWMWTLTWLSTASGLATLPSPSPGPRRAPTWCKKQHSPPFPAKAPKTYISQPCHVSLRCQILRFKRAGKDQSRLAWIQSLSLQSNPAEVPPQILAS